MSRFRCPGPRKRAAGRCARDWRQSQRQLPFGLGGRVERDTQAASTYYREALRADPRNADLIERALIATLANGNLSDGLSLAERLILRDPNNNYASGARRAGDPEQAMAFARAHFTRGSARAGRDVTTTLLTAWTYAGAGDERKALETVDRLNEGTLTVFRDYHAA